MTSKPYSPVNGTLTPATMAAGILALNPNYNPPPSRHQSMAENLIALGERVLAMNPIRLTSGPGRALPLGRVPWRSQNPHMTYASLGEKTEKGKIRSRLSRSDGAPFPPERNPKRISKTDSATTVPKQPRKFKTGPIPVPDPGWPEIYTHPESGPRIEVFRSKNRSRLQPPLGTPSQPDRNPERVPNETFGVTIAPKGGRPRIATHKEANQYQPYDSVSDMLRKTQQNWGWSQERNAEHDIWAVENRRAADGLARRYDEGLKQLLSPQEQEHEAYVKAVWDRYKDRYGSVEKAKETIVEDIDGVGDDIYFPIGRMASKALKALSLFPALGKLVPQIEDPTGTMVHKSLPYMDDKDRPPQNSKPKPGS